MSESGSATPGRVRDKRRKSFFTVDNVIIDAFGRELRSDGIAVYAYLCRCADSDELSWPKLRWIEADTGLSRSSVQRAIERLERLRLIDVYELMTDNGQKENVYVLITPGETPPPSWNSGPRPPRTLIDARYDRPLILPKEPGYPRVTQTPPPYHTDTAPISEGHPARFSETPLKGAKPKRKTQRKEVSQSVILQLIAQRYSDGLIHGTGSAGSTAAAVPAGKDQANDDAKRPPTPELWNRIRTAAGIAPGTALSHIGELIFTVAELQEIERVSKMHGGIYRHPARKALDRIDEAIRKGSAVIFDPAEIADSRRSDPGAGATRPAEESGNAAG